MRTFFITLINYGSVICNNNRINNVMAILANCITFPRFIRSIRMYKPQKHKLTELTEVLIDFHT